MRTHNELHTASHNKYRDYISKKYDVDLSVHDEYRRPRVQGHCATECMDMRVCVAHMFVRLCVLR